MNIFVTGASGMLGSNLNEVLAAAHTLHGTARGEAPKDSFTKWATWLSSDLTDHKVIEQHVFDLKPDAIIHCAALTNVDQCENNKELAEELHVHATANLTKIATELNIPLVYISTDQVYADSLEGIPHIESAKLNPVNNYARTKLAGEDAALAWEKSLIVRTNIFGIRNDNNSPSFGEWILKGLKSQEKLTMFTDVYYSPISTFNLAKIIESCLSKNIYGVFNIGGSDSISKFDFAELVANELNMSTEVIIPTKISEKGLTANRPNFMSMSCKSVEQVLNTNIPKTIESIRLWVKHLKIHGEL